MDHYEKMNETQKLKFLANLANMYYEGNMTQVEIANQLSTTRFKVSKLLQEAKDKNVVEIIINQPNERSLEIENSLVKHFQLTNAVVLNNHTMSHDETIHSLGKLGAEYVDDIITENSIVGILWGKTIFNVIKHINPKNKKPITAVQVLGAAAKDNPLIDSPELIRNFANAYGGKYKYLYAPLYIDNDYARRALLQEPVINDTLFLASKCDIILTGIGTVDAVFASTLWSNYLIENKNFYINSKKSAGCIYARLFDINGEEVDIDINKKIIGTDLNTLRQVKYTVGVASGKYKAESILGALKGKYINVLITDASTASKVLALADIHI
ncbi:DNA-binding transcriptional regulator LsrR, DeoR family [Anaerovirgula multivorans]|uniref:DNA-binding transcriptional regulator LsrR, DeoR family n=1 Tax=Anaerovirgula multivorans TaxID=312168 RepID=A0A239FRL5_9FIRM|nr:sugar-binding transcriptional regulator [Anaerovirgula multivorans]SNS59561.1 DNA-binding transcriptional regulator LsrR, DeoR family [Anaerovirgula multivorans]